MIRDIARRFEISTESIRKRSKKERWLDPREIERRGKAKLIQRRENPLESEAERWADAYQDAREDLLAASRTSIARFREDMETGKLSIKAWRELTPLLAALEKAAGDDAKQQAPQQILAYDWRFLCEQGPRPRELTAQELEALALAEESQEDAHGREQLNGTGQGAAIDV